MKAFLAGLLASVSLTASAGELMPPPGSPTLRWQCVATGFTAQGIAGVCQEKYYRAQRYAQPLIAGTWPVAWDLSGNPTVDWTRSATFPGCTTQTVVVINGVPMYLIGVNSLGNELVENNCVSYLIAP